ncbi:uncharacterized protein LOC106642226 [Copidosoma floridanum]|uniref:uncharacterized protein LOC106642226 n=1 Tax=Copidosoma floridanum TaxID=29053 RepID=UPI0006C9BE75|nr:uncharacterized protein LOC106642226 [Copidosoma floridanum]
MSASAVAARTVSPSIGVMNEEELQEPRQQKCEELKDQPSLDLSRPQRQEEEMVLADENRSAQESGAESEGLQVDAQLRAMAVSATTRATPTTGPRTDAAARTPSTATSTGTRSAGESFDDVNGKDRLKPFIRTCQRFESGSGSGDQDGMVSMEDGVDVAAKKRKTRRGKPKHRKLKPYSKQQPSFQQRLRGRASSRPNKAGRNPPAPYNTTQFLMDDHNDLPELDEKIAGAVPVSSNSTDFVSSSKPVARGRCPSFSMDSDDDDHFYSSPADEEEFLSKEFCNVYEETHAERLSQLSKSALIAEYIQLEAKIDGLNKRLRAKNSACNAAAAAFHQQLAVTLIAAAATASDPNEPRDAELAKKLKALQQRVDELQQQNEQLRRENEQLRQRHGSPMSSVDSESDSSCQSHACSDCSNHKTTSPGSSPVPASYACREKSSRRKSSSVSSVASETDSDSTDNSCPGAISPKSAATTSSNSATTPTTATT